MIVLQVCSVCRVDLVLPNQILFSRLRFKSGLWFNINVLASPAEVPAAPRWLWVQEEGKGEGEAKKDRRKKR